MLIETLSQVFTPIRVTDTTDASYPSRPMTQTKPSGVGNAAAQTTSAVVDLRQGGQFTQNSMCCIPYGQGASTNTFSLIVLSWRLVQWSGPTGLNVPSATNVWMPCPLAELTATITSFAGLGSTAVPSTELFASTLAIVGTTANAGVNINVVSPGASASVPVAHFTLDVEGNHMIEIIFKTGGVATACNALVSFF